MSILDILFLNYLLDRPYTPPEGDEYWCSKNDSLQKVLGILLFYSSLPLLVNFGGITVYLLLSNFGLVTFNYVIPILGVLLFDIYFSIKIVNSAHRQELGIIYGIYSIIIIIGFFWISTVIPSGYSILVFGFNVTDLLLIIYALSFFTSILFGMISDIQGFFNLMVVSIIVLVIIAIIGYFFYSWIKMGAPL